MVDTDNSEITRLVLKVKVFKLRNNMLDIFTHTLFLSIFKISYPGQICKIVSYT